MLVPPRDVTPEGLARLIGDHGRIDRVSLMKAPRCSRTSLVATHKGSTAWDLVRTRRTPEPDLAVDRKGSDPVIVFDPALTIAIVTQPSLLRSLAAKPDAGERGVLARPLYSLPYPVIADTPTPAASDSVVAEYHSRLLKLFDDVPNAEEDEDGRPAPILLTFAPDAVELFQDWERQACERTRENSRQRRRRAVSSSWAGSRSSLDIRLDSPPYSMPPRTGRSVPRLLDSSMHERSRIRSRSLATTANTHSSRSVSCDRHPSSDERGRSFAGSTSERRADRNSHVP